MVLVCCGDEKVGVRIKRNGKQVSVGHAKTGEDGVDIGTLEHRQCSSIAITQNVKA